MRVFADPVRRTAVPGGGHRERGLRVDPSCLFLSFLPQRHLGRDDNIAPPSATSHHRQFPYIIYCVFPQLWGRGDLICFVFGEANSEKLRSCTQWHSGHSGAVSAQSRGLSTTLSTWSGLGPRGSRHGNSTALGLESGFRLHLTPQQPCGFGQVANVP